MTTYFCDRCGKSNGPVRLNVVAMGTSTVLTERAQICDECARKFIDWLSRKD